MGVVWPSPPMGPPKEALIAHIFPVFFPDTGNCQQRGVGPGLAPPPNPYVAPFSSHSPFISAPDSHASAVPGLRPIPGISTSAYSFILAYTHTPALRLLRSVRLGIQLPDQGNFSPIYTFKNTFFYHYTYRINLALYPYQ